jgi:hypothetical protein
MQMESVFTLKKLRFSSLLPYVVRVSWVPTEAGDEQKENAWDKKQHQFNFL